MKISGLHRAPQFTAVPAMVLLAFAAVAPVDAQEMLWQTSAHGDDIQIVDIDRGEVVRRILVGPNPHGIGTDAAETTVFVSLERDGEDHGELLWIDPSTFAITHRLTIGREPHQLAVTPDGRFVYVPCRDEHYWVIDTELRETVARIRTGGRPHNTTASPDGRFMYLSPMGAPNAVTIVDVEAGHRVVGEIPFAGSVRPPAISTDGRRFFQHVDGLNGFQVADIAERRVTRTVQHSTELGWFLSPIPLLGWLGPAGTRRCHGLGVHPLGREIWSVCGEFLAIHDLEGPELVERAVISLPSKGYWLTFARARAQGFIALADRDEVAVVDMRSRTVRRTIQVGRGPKRNLVLSR